jgi:hypothetical protein
MNTKNSGITMEELMDKLHVSRRELESWIVKYEIPCNEVGLFDQEAIRLVQILIFFANSRWFTSNMASFFIEQTRLEEGSIPLLPKDAMESQIKIIELVKEARALRQARMAEQQWTRKSLVQRIKDFLQLRRRPSIRH